MIKIRLVNAKRGSSIVLGDEEYFNQYFESVATEDVCIHNVRPLNNRYLIPNIEKTTIPNIAGFKEVATIEQVEQDSANANIKKISGQKHGNRGFVINFIPPHMEDHDQWENLNETMMLYDNEKIDMYIDYVNDDRGLYIPCIVDDATSIEAGVITLQDQNEGVFFKYDGLYPEQTFVINETELNFVNSIDVQSISSRYPTRIGITLNGTLANCELKNTKNGNRFVKESTTTGLTTIDSYSNSVWKGDFENPTTPLALGTDFAGGWIRLSQGTNSLRLTNDSYPISAIVSEYAWVRTIY